METVQPLSWTTAEDECLTADKLVKSRANNLIVLL